MKEELIKSFIDRLNSNNFKETIFLRKLSNSVEYARVWGKEPELQDEMRPYLPSNDFFFIKNDIGKYVGAVLDMNTDLHWFILKEERKKGFLTKAMRKVILPYIFYDEKIEREIQRITINHKIGAANYFSSRKVAQNLGFKSKNEDETEFELKKDEFDWQYENFEEEDRKIPKERLEELRRRLIFSYRQLIKISDELLMSCGDDKGLGEAAQKIIYFNGKIKTIEWD